MRRTSGLVASETVNLLLRTALAAEPASAKPFVQRTRRLGFRLDLPDAADVIETLDGPAAR